MTNKLLNVGLLDQQINIVVALQCEAKPLIDFYKLKPKYSKPFAVYSGIVEAQSINLIVSGIGRINAAAAVAWLAAKSDQTINCWLNIGVAGHKNYAVGEILRVHQVVDRETEKGCYPPQTIKWSGKTAALLTYNSQVSEYPAGSMVDMEGAAFFSTAHKFSSSEFVQSLKIISDNQENSIDRLNAALISELIDTVMPMISDFISALSVNPISQIDLTELIGFTSHLHMTASQRQQFLLAINKLYALDALDDSAFTILKESTSTKECLHKLNNLHKAIEPSFLL